MSELEEVSERWATLADSARARHNMQPFWCLPWWTHLGHGELHVAVVETSDQLVALAPLYRQPLLGVDTRCFLGSWLLGVAEVLVAPGQEEAGEELWDHLLTLPRSVLDLRQFRLASGGMDALRRVEDHPWHGELGPASPFVAITGSWEDYWASRRRNFRRDLDRKERLAANEGVPVGIRVAFDPADVAKLVPDAAHVFDAAERHRPMLHFLAGTMRPFTIDVLNRAAEQSRLALFVLYLGDHPVATSFTFRCGDLMGGGGLRFDHAFSRFSPGQLLFRRILEHAFTTGCVEFDFGPRDAPYKREWSTGIYDTLQISAFSSPAVRALHLGSAVINSTRRKVRLAPMVKMAKGLASKR